MWIICKWGDILPWYWYERKGERDCSALIILACCSSKLEIYRIKIDTFLYRVNFNLFDKI